MRMVDEIEGVILDAVGTLIEPSPPVPLVYAEAARRQGLDLDAAETEMRDGEKRSGLGEAGEEPSAGSGGGRLILFGDVAEVRARELQLVDGEVAGEHDAADRDEAAARRVPRNVRQLDTGKRRAVRVDKSGSKVRVHLPAGAVRVVSGVRVGI